MTEIQKLLRRKLDLELKLNDASLRVLMIENELRELNREISQNDEYSYVKDWDVI